MAILSKAGITTGESVEAWHVTQSIDAFSGLEAYDVTLSGSFTLVNGTQGTNKIAVSDNNGLISFTDSITASLQGTASYADASTSASYALTTSYAETSNSASYALTASYVEGNISDLGTTPLTVVLATTTVLPLTPVYDNGPLNDGIGAFLSGSSNGALGAIDGITTVLNDRILVKNQASQLQNGIYELTQTGSASAKYILTRTTDADDTNDFDPQVVIPSTGSTQAGLLYAQTTNLPVIGTDNIVYSPITTNAYVTQATTGTQNQYQIPWWNTTTRQLSKGASNLTFNPLTNALITSGSITATGSATFIKNDTGGQTVFSVINSNPGTNRFISYIARISASASPRYTNRKITNGGQDQDNSIFNNWVSDTILESTAIGSGTTGTIGFTKGWKWANYSGSSYNNIMVLTVSGSANTYGRLGLGTDTPGFQLELTTDSAAKPGAGGLWTVSSDIRLKNTIEEANYNTCYDIVKNLPLKRYTWKPEAYTPEQISDRTVLGWIAQDVQSIFPKAVKVTQFTGSGDFYLDDCLTLDSGQIYATLYGTVKKLIEENEALKTEIQNIKTHLGI